MQMTIALAGNPNSGKTTLFNDLTGANQRVGNWPGVTVEKKEGRLRGDKQVNIVDLPGIYSLSPYTPEETVSRQYLLEEKPSVVLNILDATSLERSLYLTSMLLETGLPVVVALNMADLVKKRGDKIDMEKLKQQLGCPVVMISALKSEGVDKAIETAKAAAAAKQDPTVQVGLRYSGDVENAIAQIEPLIADKAAGGPVRWFAIKSIERDSITEKALALDSQTRGAVENIVAALETAQDDDGESIITSARYEAIDALLKTCAKRVSGGLTTSDKIDRIVTNRILALPIFIAVMVVVYYISIMSLGDWVTGWTNDVLFGELIGGNVLAWMEGIGAAAWLTSLVVDGIIGGVGAVLGFVPQMAILFVLLTFLEECGYMARVAFIMDRIFRRFGLSGKSFIPMLISSGCAVPGIMATKTIENESDRRMTIITTSFIPCGAKLPIIALIGGAIMGDAWWVAPLIYFVGIAGVIVSGIILKKTKLFAGDPAPFIMELPQYHLPSFKTMVLHVWERLKSFIIRAGTIIFVSSIVIWFLLSFGFEGGSFGMVEDSGASIMAAIGGALAVIFAPLGFGNWQSSVGVITGLVAKENLVSTMAIMMGLSDEVVEGVLDDSAPMWSYLQVLLPTVAAGLSFLIFNMLCAPCFAAIGAIRRQMESGKWTAFAVAYQCVFAYAISLMVYQFGTFFTGGGFGVGTVAAIIVLALFLFLLFRPSYDNRMKRKPANASRGA